MSGKENKPVVNQYDVELESEAKKTKLMDFGARLSKLIPLASAEGKKAAAAVAVSEKAKSLLKAYLGGRRRTRRHKKSRRKTRHRR
jgi:hypothetical protein